jgi:thiol-disulfide isomerase/thioredoxin
MKNNDHVKKVLRSIGNLFFFAVIILLLFNPGAKGWVLKQLMTAGLFKAAIEKDALAAGARGDAVSFDFRDENGNIQSVSSLKGRVVLVNFWASWCPPCVAEMPSLNELYQELKGDSRFVFLFINKDDDRARAKQFLKANGFALPLLTTAGDVPAEIYTGTLPTTVILNKEGAVVLQHQGLANYYTKEFKKQLKELL